MAFDPSQPVLSVRELSVSFKTDDGILKAVDNVSFDLFGGETLGIVGESGSGKSVTSMAILGLLPKTATITGDVLFRGESILGRPENELRHFRGNKIAMVFQDALASLNPVMTIGKQITEAIEVHDSKISKADARTRVIDLLEIVGIPEPSRRVDQYPHEFSGGMRQRAMIAMSIANEPDVLIADEPTTALDVTIQAQVMEVFEHIQARTKSSVLLITHDLGVVAGVADRVMVMYAGRQVELGSVDDVYYRTAHPYAQGLLASLPRLDRRVPGERLHRIKGQPPSCIFLPSGCAFNPRCPHMRPGICDAQRPEMHSVGFGHTSACHFAAELITREAAL
jgi:oligopeptide/dipeptide ABC transporter ATP-binding protein